SSGPSAISSAELSWETKASAGIVTVTTIGFIADLTTGLRLLNRSKRARVKSNDLHGFIELLLVGEICVESNPHTSWDEFYGVDSWCILQSRFDGQSCFLGLDATRNFENSDLFTRLQLNVHTSNSQSVPI